MQACPACTTSTLFTQVVSIQSKGVEFAVVPAGLFQCVGCQALVRNIPNGGAGTMLVQVKQ
jgi:hypothetical protein